MITSFGPAEHFQTVLQQGVKQKNLSPPARLPRDGAQDHQLPKTLAGMAVTNTTDSPAFTAISERIKSALDCLDHNALTDYLKNSDTLQAIRALGRDEQARLAEVLFKDAGSISAYQAFTTEAGMHLAAQPTSDQLLVGAIASLVMEYRYQHRRAGETGQPPEIDLKFLQLFMCNQASHSPSELINKNSRPYLTQANKDYYGVRQPTINVSQPCSLCQVYQTDQEQHDAIFHPRGLEATGPTPLVYSEKFLSLMESANLPDECKARLLPEALFGLSGCQGVDFFSLSESALIFPQLFLSSRMCQTIDEHLAEAVMDAQIIYTYRISDPGKRAVADGCFASMLYFARNIPVLARIGCQIKASLARRNVEIPKDAISERYLVKKFAIPFPDGNISSQIGQSVLPRLLASAVSRNSRVHPYLAGSRNEQGGEFFSRKAIDGVLKEAMNIVCAQSGTDLRVGSGPTFIGYIPPEIANQLVWHDGFLDSNWSLNLLHGKYPHALVLTCLACLNGLDRGTLKAIISEGVWNPLLDCNPYKVDVRFNGPSFLKLNLRPAVQDIANSAFKFQKLLTTGALSASLRDIKMVISLHSEAEQSSLLAQLGQRMAMDEPLTLETLSQITEHIDVLEKVVATKHLNSMREVLQFSIWQSRKPGALYNPERHPFYAPELTAVVGNFPSSLFSFRERIKARRCWAKGQRVDGVFKDKQGRYQVLKISSLADIEQCCAFIAYPSSVG